MAHFHISGRMQVLTAGGFNFRYDMIMHYPIKYFPEWDGLILSTT
jgi:hypothetical protein